MNAKNFPQWFDTLLDSIQSILLSILTKLGPFFVALMPALFTGYAIFRTFKAEASPELALFFALTVGIAWEVVGIVACHTALDLYNASETGIIQPGKFKLMAALVPVYVVGVAGVVYFSKEAFNPLVKGLGIASPFLTTIVYIAVALAHDISRTEAKREAIEDKQAQIEAEQREWQREKERLEMAQKHTERLAKIEGKKPASLAKSEAHGSAENAQHGRYAPPLRVPKSEWRAQALFILRENPYIKGAELGRRLGASERTGQNILNELEQAGITLKNGNGWEVSR
ncbi:MAG: winged helix-turn-helix domain-containing protein [Anaerolineales bacterium]|nr:winged helix-turn-helix domain-containing protein [Anaerolineales bacterium]